MFILQLCQLQCDGDTSYLLGRAAFASNYAVILVAVDTPPPQRHYVPPTCQSNAPCVSHVMPRGLDAAKRPCSSPAINKYA